MNRAALCEASPSLALLKYWGKRDAAANIPATTSIAVSLGGLRSTTRVRVLSPGEGGDRVFVNGELQPEPRFEKYFSAVRAALRSDLHFEAESTNNFPTSAGLASSSSGFAALTLACNAAAGGALNPRELSELARVGSASAARAIFGGFTILQEGANSARQLYDENYWPELRVVVCVVESRAKKTSSRAAMEASRLTSPYYRAWVRSSRRAVPRIRRALRYRDIEQLGDALRLSYLRMFSTLISSDPPTLYWLPESVEIINECVEMREAGIGVWETMDAGPQVKLICLADEVDAVRRQIDELRAASRTIVCEIGGAPECRIEGDEG